MMIAAERRRGSMWPASRSIFAAMLLLGMLGLASLAMMDRFKAAFTTNDVVQRAVASVASPDDW